MNPESLFSDHSEVYINSNRTLMSLLSNRFHPSYPWIDMKYDIVTGEDFPINDELRGKDSVYSWIQGRGLESIALHSCWLESMRDTSGVERLEGILRIVRDSLSKAVLKSDEYLSFVLDRQGNPRRDKNVMDRSHFGKGQLWSFGDVFASRGLFMAARRLGCETSMEEAYCFDTVRAAFDRRLVNDQFNFDDNNNAYSCKGRHSHAGFMLGIGTMNLLWRETGDIRYQEVGLQCIEHILDIHVNNESKWEELPPWSFTEYVDDTGLPYIS